MNKISTCMLAIACTFLLSAQNLQAATMDLLIGADSARSWPVTDSNLYYIIPTTGVTGIISSTGGTRFTSLARDNAGNLVGSTSMTSTNNLQSLVTIDLFTGAVTQVVPQAYISLASDGVNMYGASPKRWVAGAINKLFSIDPVTHVGTLVGGNVPLRALGMDNLGTLYGASDGVANSDSANLYTVDPATGTSTLVGTMAPIVFSLPRDISFAADGTMYVLAWGRAQNGTARSDLVTVDPATAAVINTVPLILPSGNYIETISQYTFTDTDGDGMPDFWETANGLNPTSAADATLDGDGDGLTNLLEFQNGTNMAVTDTDGDGISDGFEVNTLGTHPTVTDSDRDGVNDTEYLIGRDPLATDAAGNGPSLLSNNDHPAVVEDAAGNAHVLWSAWNGTGNFLYYKMVSAAGAVLIDTTEITQVADPRWPNAHVDPAGRILVTYYDDRVNTNAMFLRLEPALAAQDGTAADPALLVTVAPVVVNTGSRLAHVQSAMDSAGNLHVVGDKTNVGLNPAGAAYVKIDGNGALLAGPIALGTSSRHHSIDVATDAAGNAHISWASAGDPGTITYARVNAAGVADIPRDTFGVYIPGGLDFVGGANQTTIAVDAANMVYMMDGGPRAGAPTLYKVDPAQYNPAVLAATNVTNMTVYAVAATMAGGDFPSAFFAADGNLHVVSNDANGSGGSSFYDTAFNPVTGAVLSDTLLTVTIGGGDVGQFTFTQASPNWVVWPEGGTAVGRKNIVTGASIPFDSLSVDVGSFVRRNLLLTDLPAAAQAGAPTTLTGLKEIIINGLTPGATVIVTIGFSANVPVGSSYMKWDLNSGWYNFPYGSDNGDSIITLTLVDGGAGDADGMVNGQILDPGGLAAAPAAPATSTTSGGLFSPFEGGCTIGTADNKFDPVLPLLVLTGLFMVWTRRKRS